MSGPRNQTFDSSARCEAGSLHWWAQRGTAVILIPTVIWLTLSLMYLSQADYGVVLNWFAQPVNIILMSAFIIALFWHLKLGLEVVIDDYVRHPLALRLLNIGNAALCLIFGAISITSVVVLAVS